MTPTDHTRPPLEMRPFGELGERVSAFGLGLGPLTHGGEDAPWDATLGRAIELGVTVVDAAPRELRPVSEQHLGRLLHGRRDDLFLSTRCSPLDGRPFDTSPAALRAELEASLERLGTDRIDLYQIHDVEASHSHELVEVALPALVAARERGDVRYIGASGGCLDTLIEVVATYPIDAVLSYAHFDLVDSSLEEQLLSMASERGIAVVNASPLHMGLLADPARVERAEAADSALAPPTRRAFEIAARTGVPLSRLALAFAAGDARIATTLVGCQSAQELEHNVHAFMGPPSPSELAAIQDVRAAYRDAAH